MHLAKKVFTGLLFSVTLTSCFEIIEEVSFHRNGSGTMKLIFNMSQSKNEINALMKLDSSSGYRIPTMAEINADLNHTMEILKKTEGLSRPELRKDFVNWIFEFKTDFNHSESLEKAADEIFSHFRNRNPVQFINRFSYSGNTFRRNFRLNDEDAKQELNAPTARNILSKAQYTSIYRFESPIRDYSNKKAKLSPSGKAIMLRCNMLNLLNEKESIQNVIQTHP